MPQKIFLVELPNNLHLNLSFYLWIDFGLILMNLASLIFLTNGWLNVLYCVLMVITS